MSGTIKTFVNDASVDDFINSVDGDMKKADAYKLVELYKEATNEKPKKWGSSMIGFGQYHYKSERSKQEADWPLAAFSPRKQTLTLYVFMPGFDYSDLLEKLGKHKTSKACLYINKLSDVDIDVLGQLIKRSYDDAARTLARK
ncbi:hypothetical protein D3C87_1680710 [compost metagenome]